MKSTICRRLIAILAVISITGILAGCESDDPWNHPNRQQYAAPPQIDDSQSFEELKQSWQQRDRRSDRHAKSAARTLRPTLDKAAQSVRDALETAINESASPAAIHPSEDRAVGGGPPSNRRLDAGDM